MIPRSPVERPSAMAVAALHRHLAKSVRSSTVLVEKELCQNYASDESDQEPVLPDAVVLATNAEDVRGAIAAAVAANVPIVPRGSGTGKSGGAVPVGGGLVVSTTSMSRIIDVDVKEMIAVVEPGIVVGNFHECVETQGLFYPPDPNSLKMCAIGGNIAENAGGPRAFKYGVTRDYVLGLETMLSDGTHLRSGRRTTKGVTGYDVTALLTGSEGTLGVFTSAILKLIPKPTCVSTLMALFTNADASAATVSAILTKRLRPRCIEFFDETTLQVLRERASMNIHSDAHSMLLIEVDGSEQLCETELQEVGDACVSSGAIEVLVAQDPAKRERLWDARRKLSATLKSLHRYKISEDVVVPRTLIPQFLSKVRWISETIQVFMLTYGHAGDGNLHVNFLWDDPLQVTSVAKGLQMLFECVVKLGGTLTGEHGVGTSKSDFLMLEQSNELIAIQKKIKDVFDPKGLMNPFKIFPRSNHGAC